MSDLDVETLIALGTSPSAGRLNSYHDSIHPLQASPVIDAYFLGESRTNLRTNLGVPVLRLLSEVDVAAGCAPADSDTYRHWEVASASHADAGSPTRSQGLHRTGPDPADRAGVQPQCAQSDAQALHVPRCMGSHGAIGTTGCCARSLRSIHYADGQIVRDGYGNANGGIALSEHVVATAYNGTGNGGGTFCNLFRGARALHPRAAPPTTTARSRRASLRSRA